MRTLWIFLAAVYVEALSLASLLGILLGSRDDRLRPKWLIHGITGVCLLGAFAGISLFLRRKESPLLFLACAPIAAFALAVAFPESLWAKDVPVTVLLAIPYGLLAFKLVQPRVHMAFGHPTDRGWWDRGGGFLLGASASLAFIAYMTKDRPSILLAMFVQTIFWSYFPALLAVWLLPLRRPETRGH